MASEWQKYRLNDIAEVIDSLHKSPSYSDHGYSMVRVTDIRPGFLSLNDTFKVKLSVFDEFTKKYKPKKGDIVFSRVGSYGVSSYVSTDEPFCLGQNTVVINPKIDGRFLYLTLQSAPVKHQIESVTVGTTQKTISLKSIKNIEILCPDVEEQKAIAHILGSLDDKIELNRQMNATLEAMAQALFKSWFVDFDPVIDNALAAGNPIPDELEAKAAARQALGDARKPLPENIRSLFPNAFVFTEEMGWIPEGWEVVKLQELLDIKYGKDHKKLGDGDIPVYGSGGIMRFADKALYQGESILIPRKGTLSNLMYVNEELWTVDTMFYSVPKSPVFAKFLFYHLKTFDFNSMNVGSAVPSMTTKVLNDLDTPNPDTKVLIAFDQLLSDFFDKMKSINNESKSLTGLRDTLLPQLLSGELRIPEAEQLIKEAIA